MVLSVGVPGVRARVVHEVIQDVPLDTTNHLLWREGDRVPIAPKGFDVPAYLVEHAGRLVTQDEILEALCLDKYLDPFLNQVGALPSYHDIQQRNREADDHRH
jgi:hypothetical protein